MLVSLCFEQSDVHGCTENLMNHINLYDSHFILLSCYFVTLYCHFCSFLSFFVFTFNTTFGEYSENCTISMLMTVYFQWKELLKSEPIWNITDPLPLIFAQLIFSVSIIQLQLPKYTAYVSSQKDNPDVIHWSVNVCKKVLLLPVLQWSNASSNYL